MRGVGNRELVKTVLVDAAPERVWWAWTTVEGLKTFFAPDAEVQLAPGGKYEVLFDLDMPDGLKGSEGCRVLSFVPPRMLSFTWSAPPKFPQARKDIAQWVVVFLEPSGDHTLVTLVELGWKEGEEGEAVYSYFERAWVLVLERLAYSFSKGPIDWEHPYVPAPATGPGR